MIVVVWYNYYLSKKLLVMAVLPFLFSVCMSLRSAKNYNDVTNLLVNGQPVFLLVFCTTK